MLRASWTWGRVGNLVLILVCLVLLAIPTVSLKRSQDPSKAVPPDSPITPHPIECAATTCTGTASNESGQATQSTSNSSYEAAQTAPGGSSGGVAAPSYNGSLNFTEENGLGPNSGALSAATSTNAEPRPAAVYNGHYWYSGDYVGTNYTATHVVKMMYTSIFVPSAPTLGNEYYFELLSAFDNLGYYDQVGLMANKASDSWNIVWANLYYASSGGHSGCGYGGNWSYTSSLSLYSWYTFFMYLNGTGIVFRVYGGAENVNGTSYWNWSRPDPASTFELGSYVCRYEGGSPGLSFTNFQEVYNLTNGQYTPLWEFYFGYTTIAWWGGNPTWAYTGIQNSAFSASCNAAPGYSCPTPNSYYILVYYDGTSGRILTIANQVFREYFTYDTVYITPGNSNHQLGADTAQGPYCPSFSCSMTASCTFPFSWTGTIQFSNSYISSTNAPLYWNISVPSGASAGNFQSVCTSTASISPQSNEWTTFYWYVTVS
jgi:hypothetical protein